MVSDHFASWFIDRALQGHHDFLAVVDRQADITVEQAFVAFLNPNFLATDIAKRAIPLNRDRPLHRVIFSATKAMVIDQRVLTIRGRPRISYRPPARTGLAAMHFKLRRFKAISFQQSTHFDTTPPSSRC
ncbi:hypothetical protein X735_32695 [Mesorhizobium sp. L2C085B000]|uniref:hypothetical protein n=1 Tax=Mesorhizobium sp. L2C085B000 TaxID=1287117 RepID=UPI0003CF9F71|nr:hypothetical protein [Mesorhizobium sp. L2C085B000]ESZ04482.1 hypothetical protein X735_32695 [Mesorhizobium sp. L2C085B000]